MIHLCRKFDMPSDIFFWVNYHSRLHTWTKALLYTYSIIVKFFELLCYYGDTCTLLIDSIINHKYSLQQYIFLTKWWYQLKSTWYRIFDKELILNMICTFLIDGCPSGFIPHGANCYFVSKTETNWAGAMVINELQSRLSHGFSKTFTVNYNLCGSFIL